MNGRRRHELGGDQSYSWLVGEPATHPTTDARLLNWDAERGLTLVGIMEWHARPDGTKCGGAVLFVRSASEPDRPIWQVVSLDPLHLEPSIHCDPEEGGCGTHGWIRDGRWVVA